MKAMTEGHCHRLDLHYDAPDTARFDEGDEIGWSFVGNGWAHTFCLRDEEDPEEFQTTPRWVS